MATIIFHIAARADWQAALAAGTYRADSLQVDGFIHCSTAEQVVRVAQRFFCGREDLVLLSIAVERLEAEVRSEDLAGEGELFPHLYGALNLDAIVAVEVWVPDSQGNFVPTAAIAAARQGE